MALYYNFGVEIEAIVEPHNKGQPVPAPIPDHLRHWYNKLAAALRNRRGTDQRPLRAIAESNRTKYRQQEQRHLQWWVTWDGSLVHPQWPRHPGGR